MTTTPDPVGLNYLKDTLVRVSSTEWFVRSRRSAPGAWWRVQTTRGDEPICGCPAGRNTLAGEITRQAVACAHFRMAVDFEIKRDRLANPRPTMPAAPAGLFVD